MNGTRQLATKVLARIVWRLALTRPILSLSGAFAGGGSRNPFGVARRLAPAVPILTYHRFVAGKPDPFFAGMPVAAFESQVRFLTEYYRILPVAELVARLHQGAPVPRNSLAITFDDGYVDNYTLAFPILKRFGAPATIFLTTSFIDQAEVPWNDKVAHAIKETSQEMLSVVLGGTPLVLDLRTEESRLSALDQLLLTLRRVSHREKLQAMGVVFRQLGVQDFSALNGTMLDWDQVREMRRDGIAFGAHTVTHPILSRISADEAAWEMRESRNRIHEELSENAELFAYPNGKTADFSETHKALARSLGFRAALTTIPGQNTASTDPFELRRGGPREQSLPEFAMKLALYRFLS